jgi:PAS domain S-box-containing protein
MGTRVRVRPPGLWLWAAFVVFALGLAIGAYAYFRHTLRRAEREYVTTLDVIANLKVGQIATWRNGVVHDARMQTSGLARDGLVAWLAGPKDPGLTRALARHWAALRPRSGYDEAVLLDSRLRVLWRSSRMRAPVEPAALQLASRAARMRTVQFGDLVRCADGRRIHLDVASPVMDSRRRPVAVLLLRTDPTRTLYPLVESWPTPSPSAETLLVRREEDHALILNPLRHVKAPPLTVQLPMTRSDIPGVHAAMGHTGEFAGLDYRNVPVLSYTLPVPASPWSMVSKVDMREVREQAYRESALIAGLAALAVATAGILVGLVLSRKQSALYGDLLEAEREASRSRVLLAATTDTVLVVAPLTARIVDANASACARLHRSRDELIGMTMLDLVPALTPARWQEIVAAARGAERTIVEVVIRRQDGSEYPAEVAFRIADMDGSDYVVCSGRDVTERKQAERFLRESEEHFRATFEHANIGIAHVGLDGRWVRVNQRLCEIVGYTHGELAEMTLRDITHPDDLDADLHHVARLLRGEADTYAMEKRYLRKDGSLVWINLTVALIRDSAGNASYFVAAAEDISARKHHEAALARSNRDLEQFAYVASHDLQEPLRMVSSYLQLLAQRYAGRLDKDADEFIAFAVDGAQRMQQLILDLLAYSRVTTRGADLEPVNLNDALADALASLRAPIEESGARIVSDPLPTAVGDRSQLARLFQNIVANAVKFRKPTEAPSVRIAWRPEQDSATRARIEIADDGIGIDPRHHARAFAVFQRLHSRTEYPGTGIGLAICQRIVERHGGEIGVESSGEGQGCTFWFTLPLAE